MRTSTFGTLAIDETNATWELRVAAVDLLTPLALSESLTPRDAALAVQDRRKDVQAYVGDRLHLFVGERACTATPRAFSVNPAADPVNVTLAFSYACPAEAGAFRARYDLFFDLDALATGFVNVRLNGEAAVSDAFRSDSRELTVVLDSSFWRPLRRFWMLGVEHIFTGYDHLAFLAGLLLLAAVAQKATAMQPLVPASARGALANTAKIVTAFTLSHSVTLIAAALHPELVPTRIVEPVIALSVAAVGAENLLPRLPRRRWILAFAFGLIHGFGFASVLSEIGLPRSGVVAALLAFNVGVECGQLCVVLAVLPVLLFAARRAPRVYHRLFVGAGSVVLVAAGLFWLFQRLQS